MIKTKKYTIKEIFKDNWILFLSYIYSIHKNIRPSILHEVSRILSCQEVSSGYSLYGCCKCHKLKYVPFTCKSRFCNSCGVLYSSHRAKSIKSKLFKCNHRHVIFTIPKELRPFFLNDRKLLNILFKASAETILTWFREQNKSKAYTPGIICVLHTFGRDLKWNPHIHILVSEGAFSKNSEWKNFSYIPFAMLRKRWRTLLLNELYKKIPTPQFKALMNKLYKNYPDGFYVNAVKKPVMFKGVIDYIIRYIGRPVMAQSRILNYDKKQVTFWYQPHGCADKVVETISAFKFIARLIRHIPENHFKMLRYYGFYASSSLLSVPKKTKSRRYSWRSNIISSFSYDPLACPNCGNILELLFVKNPKKPFDKNSLFYYHDD